jgi:hypothetical protein
MGAIPEQHVEPLPTYEDSSGIAVAGSSLGLAVPAYHPNLAQSSVPEDPSPSYDAPPSS